MKVQLTRPADHPFVLSKDWSMAVNLTSHDTFLRYDKEKLIIESLEPTKNAEIGPHQVTVILTAKVNG